MRLSISNIAWPCEWDEKVYKGMKQFGFTGLEIAPTRWFKDSPYEHISEVCDIYSRLNQMYGLRISSLQSIWYGRTENIWNSPDDRESLAEYTEKAIDFAAAMRCNNLVFGCPKNRNRPEGTEENDLQIVSFFRKLGIYAEEHHTVVALEANPLIYNTNYINCTQEAVALIKRVASSGIRLNLDVGTIVANGEFIEDLEGVWEYINHVHISEPFLAMIKKRSLHRELADALRQHGYSEYVSIEMGKQDDIEQIYETMAYIAEVFG